MRSASPSELPSIILLNGASSSGKSTLARALQSALPVPYLHYSSDLLVDGGMLPRVERTVNDNPRSWNLVRPRFFDGFQRSIAPFAAAGNRLIVEHVIEHKAWFDDLVERLSPFDVLYVGVMCPADELDRRERERGDRALGEGRSHLEDGIHTWSDYDLEVDTHALSTLEAVARVQSKILQFSARHTVFRRHALSAARCPTGQST